MYCKEVRRRVLEETLEGEVFLTGPLGQHLQACIACRYFVARLGEVDAALHSLPLDTTPAAVTLRIMEQIPSAPHPRTRSFLPWTLWLPVVSLLTGIFWAYVALLWNRGADLKSSLDPTLATWINQLEQWLASNQGILSAVALSITAGLLFTLFAVGLGLYVGRERPATSH